MHFAYPCAINPMKNRNRIYLLKYDWENRCWVAILRPEELLIAATALSAVIPNFSNVLIPSAAAHKILLPLMRC